MGVQIHDDEKGHWLQVNAKHLTGGKRPKSFFGHGSAAKKACADAAAEILRKIGEGKFAIKREADKKTLQEVGDALFTPNGHRRDSTLESYENALAHVYPTIGTKQVGEITADDIKTLLALWRKDAKGSVNLRLNVLGTILNHCVREGLIARNPVGNLERAFKRGLRKRDTVAKVRAMSRPQLASVLDTLQRYNTALAFNLFWLLLGRTGLRIGEAMALQPNDIDLDNRKMLVQRACYKGTIGPTKTGESRHVDISEELALAFDDVFAAQTTMKGTDWIFASPRNIETPASYLYWLKHLTAATGTLKLGLKITPHLFRHTFASQLLQAGGTANLKYVSKQLGHARPSMTLDVYAHFLPDENNVAPVNLLDNAAAHPRRTHASIHTISEHANHSNRNKLSA